MRSQFSCSVLASLAGLVRNTPFCRQVLTERHRKGLLQTVQTTTISPESNRKGRFCSGSFLRPGRACAWVRGTRRRRSPLHLPFASPKERRKRRRQDPPPSSSSLFPLRLDNRNGTVKTNFGGEEGMQECGK